MRLPPSGFDPSSDFYHHPGQAADAPADHVILG